MTPKEILMVRTFGGTEAEQESILNGETSKKNNIYIKKNIMAVKNANMV